MYTHHGLRGAERIVFEDMCRLIAAGHSVSLRILADESGYSTQTVFRAVCRLRERGLVRVRARGRAPLYEIAACGDADYVSDLIKALIAALETIRGEAEHV